VRCRFAQRFGESDSEDGTEKTREGALRDAFNSPFRPFVLASTSIGQEGLDFHPYCHALVDRPKKHFEISTDGWLCGLAVSDTMLNASRDRTVI
jgi:hypothetical protein